MTAPVKTSQRDLAVQWSLLVLEHADAGIQEVVVQQAGRDLDDRQVVGVSGYGSHHGAAVQPGRRASTAVERDRRAGTESTDHREIHPRRSRGIGKALRPTGFGQRVAAVVATRGDARPALADLPRRLARLGH